MMDGNDQMEGLEWDGLAANEEYRALVRALRRKKGFGLFFVQARQGDRILEELQRDLAGKSFVRVQIEREDEALFDKLDAVWEREIVDVFWIDGLDRSLLGYEDVKRRAGWDDADLTDYSDRDVPPILSHLNMGRERFMQRFDCSLVFVVPLFVVRYLLKRSSDFFDWGSGFFEFADSLEERQQFVQEVMESSDYQAYVKLSPVDRDEKIFQIEERLADAELDIEMQAKLWREVGRLFDSGKQYERAIVALKKALKMNPDYSDALRSVGSAYNNLGRYEEAIGAYQKTIELTPEDATAYNSLASTYRALKRYEEAIDTYQKAIELTPKYATAYNNLGITYRTLERYEEAIGAYQKVIELTPKYTTAYNNLGNTYKAQKRYEEAIGAYQKVIELTPKYTTAYNNLGILQYNIGDFQSSLSTFQKILELQPDQPSHLNNISYLHLLQSDLDKAEKTLEGITNKDIFDRAWLNYGLIQSQRGNIKEAMQSWQNGLNLMECDSQWDKAVHCVFTVALGNVHEGLEQIQKLINEGLDEFTLRNALNDATLILRSPHYPEGIEDMVQLLQTALSSMETI